jgi:hypothetical protein
MKKFIVLTLLFFALAGYSQKKQTYKIGVFANISRSDLYIISSLKNDGKIKHFPTFNPIITFGFGATISSVSHKLWYNALTLESQTIGFVDIFDIGRYQFAIAKLSTGINYKKLYLNCGTGLGFNYISSFKEQSYPRTRESSIEPLNHNKKIIIPIDFEIGISKSRNSIALNVQSILGEFIPNMILISDYRFYNYPFNIGLKVNYLIIN